jgi:hypothetical protein
MRRSVARPRLLKLAPLLLAALCAVCASGCNIAGYLAAVGEGAQTVPPNYKGLAGQKCAVLVWADDGLVDDFRTIQLDTARGIQHKLESAAKVNVGEVANITWVPPEQILQFQQNHPEMDFEAAEEIAPRLGVTRLIYVEVEDFQTHPNSSPDLWRGYMAATLKIVEVEHGKAKIAYTERNIRVVAPRNCPAEGLPNLDDATIYTGVLDYFTSAAAERFVPHEADVDDDSPPEQMFQ